jgi:hypothetical protein
MRHMFIGDSYNRKQMIKIFGGKDIEKLESENCEPTGRLMDACDEIVEFTASIIAYDLNGNECLITAYYYQHDPIEVENLDDLEWEIDDYGIRISRFYWNI